MTNKLARARLVFIDDCYNFAQTESPAQSGGPSCRVCRPEQVRLQDPYPSYSGEVVWREVSSKSARMDEHSMPGIVAEMSRAVDNAVARLASSLQDHVAPASASRRGTN